MSTVREGGRATIIQYCAVFGTSERHVRAFNVRDGERAYPTKSVIVSWTDERGRASMAVTLDDLTYVVIELEDGCTYDSRNDIPCDMSKWEATRKRFPGGAIQVVDR